ncbi:Hypothetical predicted protein [Mytilus galloprovincialis]|uniref:SMP-30/Gluconolactonase/LRE-like region domain-containing protein n=1 Tax=Mytilus galloprovincialis TaxID=29158 RepID=A0A8B6BVZ0_MYTGA|nr:Hypothetical predicted protein [Mytilus galloprovincialis]
MEHQASQIDLMQSQFTKMTQYATQLQMYIGLREIEKITSQATKYFEDFESAEEKNLEVNISSALQSIFQNVKSFGDIKINATSSTCKINAGRKDQAQHFVPKVSGIEQIKPNLLTTLTLPEDMKHLDIYACLILPDEEWEEWDLLHFTKEISMAYILLKTKTAAIKVLKNLSGHIRHKKISDPKGLTLDKNGFVYIASNGNNSIVVVSPDGTTCKTILSEADGIKDPWAIDIKRETRLMIV